MGIQSPTENIQDGSTLTTIIDFCDPPFIAYGKMFSSRKDPMSAVDTYQGLNARGVKEGRISD